MKHPRAQKHEDLLVWKKSIELVTQTYRVSADFPTSERFGLSQQLRRAAVSIPANIAEGWGRASRGELRRFISIARGSLMEVQTLFVIADQLGLTTAVKLTPTRAISDEIGRMLWTMMRRLS